MDPGTQPPARLRTTPSWLLTQTAAHAGRLVADGLGAVAARGYHYRLLAALHEGGPASQADLGRRCGIDRSDVVAALNELATRDLIRRDPDPDDRRRNVITLTPAGRRELHRMEQALDHVQTTLLAPLSGPERAELTRLLTALLDHHQQPR
ncbi:MarR family winged helix-turn-helix transcriptional regulator [Micromonospora sp. PLK6-60]|uniref:MarR family winged helix-turn-helix transcriptional regulator n=1 Tax=Micromonospora sp. PLK6-60 TaxID=2873383 RepID=UPI001CA737B9|nr:MarR family winged helix-turn-helix transcriptional regulator [Micromonospora sp. PLK6-60]MBY8875808.1 MarR family winged helix-turn-helix transcriptional regulator [Micromonospora sp. PLK6-60]